MMLFGKSFARRLDGNLFLRSKDRYGSVSLSYDLKIVTEVSYDIGIQSKIRSLAMSK